MEYPVTFVFEILNETLEQQQDAAAELAALGFSRWLAFTHGGHFTLPGSTWTGTFSGPSPETVHAELAPRIRQAFARRRIQAVFFLSIDGRWFAESMHPALAAQEVRPIHPGTF